MYYNAAGIYIEVIEYIDVLYIKFIRERAYCVANNAMNGVLGASNSSLLVSIDVIIICMHIYTVA